ncbi:MAG: glycosyltransferase [Kiritimatiellia bacterium]
MRRTVVKIAGGTVSRFMGGRGLDWGDDLHFTCDPAARGYDWFCVYDELRGNRLVRHGALALDCPRAHTILATQEPVSVKSYSRAYTRQFAYLLTNRPPEAENHPGYRRGAGYMVWYTGRSFGEEKARTPGEKRALISAIYSAKRMRHTQHRARAEFLARLAREIPGFVRYGKGVRPIATKADALDDFRYTVAFENHIAPGHWTEKIADAIVTGCLAFYAGDPCLGEILPREAFIPIPADDPERALGIIRAAIAADEYAKRRPAIAQARKLLFEKYNLFAQLAAVVRAAQDAGAPAAAGSAREFLRTRHRLRLNPLVALEDGCGHLRRLARALFGKGGCHG